MTREIAKRLIPIFKADLKKYRRQAGQSESKANNFKSPNRHEGRYVRKLLLFSVCKQLLIECYNIKR